MESPQIPPDNVALVPHIWFYETALIFMKRCCHFPDGKSLQRHMRALIRNYDCRDLIFESLTYYPACFTIHFRNCKDYAYPV